ncbi:hypothetical protein CBR_g51917 [Chara braunii]|uniref:Fungal lipase-type domain-containing protein n=1 Tax=Chara braunii TaxID=69332 RepID=A0A388M9F4_CHABU|nr:hypothetical protein CBR_g51917 [Chara braunii]|eukprot:GBG91113.1 hypothetical protein CBR_g51917 [Chara braunii]
MGQCAAQRGSAGGRKSCATLILRDDFPVGHRCCASGPARHRGLGYRQRIESRTSHVEGPFRCHVEGNGGPVACLLRPEERRGGGEGTPGGAAGLAAAKAARGIIVDVSTMKRRLCHVSAREVDAVMQGLRERGESLSRPGLDESTSNGLLEKKVGEEEEEEEEEGGGGRPNSRRKVFPPLAALRSVRIGEWLPFNKVWDALKVTASGGGGGGGGGGVGGAVEAEVVVGGEREDEDRRVRGKVGKEGRRVAGMDGEGKDDDRGKAGRGNDANTSQEREEKSEQKREEVSKKSEWGQELKGLIYHMELARGAYQKDLRGLARMSMLRRSRILKFVSKASVMEPAYFIAVDDRRKLVVFGVRGTLSVNDLVTDLLGSGKDASSGSTGDRERERSAEDKQAEKAWLEPLLQDGVFGNYGMTQAAVRLLRKELSTLEDLLERHKGYNLRLVGHSLGGATACLITMILRKNESMHRIPKEAISCISFATPPCVPREAAIECADYITTIVLQDDVIPRMSVQAFERLRAEILLTDWSAILKEGAKRVEFLRLVANTIESVQPTLTTTLSTLSSAQQTAWKYASKARLPGIPGTEMVLSASKSELIAKLTSGGSAAREAALGALRKAGVLPPGPSGYLPQPGINNGSSQTAGEREREREGPQQASHPTHLQDMSAEEKSPGAVKESAMAAIEVDLHVPGQLVHLVRRTGSGERTGTTEGGKNIPNMEGGNSIPNEGDGMDTDVVKIFIGPVENRFARIILSDTMVSDHSCSNYWSALRDALKTI